MKIEHLEIKKYKQFKDLTLDLTYPKGHEKEGEPLDKICIIGQSGTGKTNLLEIIRDKKNNDDIQMSFVKEKISNYEKIYFASVEKHLKGISFQTNIEMSSYDKQLLEQLDYAKGKLVLEEINEPRNENYFSPIEYREIRKIVDMQNGTKTVEDKREELNWEINRIKNKYNFDKKENKYTNPNIIYINNNDNTFKVLKEKIDNYDIEKGQYTKKLSNKLVYNVDYSKDDFIKELKVWEQANENILDKIAISINDIIQNFNLELKIDETTQSYEELILKDLATGNIVNYENISTGTKKLLSTFIPLKSYNPKDSIILIDEPENSFYPDIQRILTELYMEVGENNQLIMATHSPLIASSFEPWEVVELKFDENNQIYREKYYEGENHVDNYTLDPRMLTWTGILTDIFDLDEHSNGMFRKKKLLEYSKLKTKIKKVENIEEKEELFKKLQTIGKQLGLYNQ